MSFLNDYLDNIADNMNAYGTCSTSAATATKVVTCSGFTLVTGSQITVKFTYANTYTGATYLNVNNTGAKRVRDIDGSTAKVNGLWDAGGVVTFVYDGSSWLLQDMMITAAELTTLETALGIS